MDAIFTELAVYSWVVLSLMTLMRQMSTEGERSMSLFLIGFVALLGIYFLCAIIAELAEDSQPDNYKVPKNWKSGIFTASPKKSSDKTSCLTDCRRRRRSKPTENASDHPQDQPSPEQESSSAWFTILVIAYILCLIFLTKWEWFRDKLYPDGEPKDQERAVPSLIEFQQ